MAGWELIGKEEKKALNKLIDKDGGILLAHGFDKYRKRHHVREFERICSKKFKSKYCLCVSSGTAALKIALISLGVKAGDEVITQAFNFIATIEAILDIGAKPIIANIDSSLNMDPNDLKRLITKKTKAIIPVHMLGVSANMKEILRIAKRKKIKVLEDNCESVGGKYNKKFLGTLSDIGVFSFDFAKMITTGGEGGLVLTNNSQLYKIAKEYHDHGHQNNPKFPRGNDTKSIYGFNYRMTELQAVVGKEQIKKLNYIIKDNKKKYFILNAQIKKKFNIRYIPNNSIPAYDCFIFEVRDKSLRNKIIKLLNQNGVGTKNLPDALKWHCSFFWPHALPKKQTQRSKKTFKILSSRVAIPIWQRIPTNQYLKIAKKISNLI